MSFYLETGVLDLNAIRVIFVKIWFTQEHKRKDRPLSKCCCFFFTSNGHELLNVKFGTHGYHLFFNAKAPHEIIIH